MDFKTVTLEIKLEIKLEILQKLLLLKPFFA